MVVKTLMIYVGVALVQDGRFRRKGVGYTKTDNRPTLRVDGICWKENHPVLVFVS